MGRSIYFGTTAEGRKAAIADLPPEPPGDLRVEIERKWDGGGFRIHDISYQVEADERAHPYLAIPDGPVPDGGHPGAPTPNPDAPES